VREQARVQAASSRASGGAFVVGARHNPAVERTASRGGRPPTAAAHLQR
jgi:hypothetical protein